MQFTILLRSGYMYMTELVCFLIFLPFLPTSLLIPLNPFSSFLLLSIFLILSHVYRIQCIYSLRLNHVHGNLFYFFPLPLAVSPFPRSLRSPFFYKRSNPVFVCACPLFVLCFFFVLYLSFALFKRETTRHSCLRV